jgi:hypothetical protein
MDESERGRKGEEEREEGYKYTSSIPNTLGKPCALIKLINFSPSSSIPSSAGTTKSKISAACIDKRGGGRE